MTRFALSLAALALLSACEGMVPPAAPPAEPVAPQPVDLNSPPVVAGREGGADPQTGIDRTGLANLVPTARGLDIYYREDAVPADQLAAAPEKACKARGMTVASVTTRDLEKPNEMPGVRVLSVRCEASPATPAVPATTTKATAAPKA